MFKTNNPREVRQMLICRRCQHEVEYKSGFYYCNNCRVTLEHYEVKMMIKTMTQKI